MVGRKLAHNAHRSLILVCIAVVLAGMLSFHAAYPSSDISISITPEWINSLANRTFTLYFESGPTSVDAVNEIRIMKPAVSRTSITCDSRISEWDLASPFGTAVCAYATSTNPLAAGMKMQVSLHVTFGEGYVYNLTVLTTDNGTENSETTYLVPIKLDRTAPQEIALTSPASGSWYKEGAGVYVEGSAEDMESGFASCTASIDPFIGYGTPTQLNYSSVENNCKGIFALPAVMQEGKHFLVIDEYDVAGNRQTRQVELNIDNTPPVISGIEARNLGSEKPGFVRPGAEVVVKADIRDSGSGFSAATISADLHRLTGKGADVQVQPSFCDAASCSWKVVADPSGEAGGRALITVFGTDRSSSGSVFKEAGAIFDSRKPAIKLQAEVPAISAASSLQLPFAVQDDLGGSGVDSASASVLIDSGPIKVTCTKEGVCTSSAEGLSEGAHALEIAASDYAGNAAEPVRKDFTVDTRPPAMPKVSATFKLLGGLDKVTLSAEVSDETTPVTKVVALVTETGGAPQTVELYNAGDGKTWAAAFAPRTDLKAGYSVEFSAADAAGNVQKGVMEANLFQIVVVGLLVHAFAFVLVAIFLYWAYTKTVRKHRLEAHYEGYTAETLGQKIDSFWFRLTGLLSRKRHYQKKL